MKHFINFLPLILFFIIYKIDPRVIQYAGYDFTIGGIYSATFVLIVSTILIYGLDFFYRKKLDKEQIITLFAVIIFGGLTLTFHSETFIKWKAPVINWIFGMSFLLSRLVSKQFLVKKIMGHVIEMPDNIWKCVNYSWAIFFIALGTANLYVAFTFEKIWVDFKVYGSFGITMLFMIIQFIIIGKHVKPINKEKL